MSIPSCVHHLISLRRLVAVAALAGAVNHRDGNLRLAPSRAEERPAAEIRTEALT
jgi:hypothetical protein